MHVTVRNNRCISVLKPYLFVLFLHQLELHGNFKLYCFYVTFQYLSFHFEVMANLLVRFIQELVLC